MVQQIVQFELAELRAITACLILAAIGCGGGQQASQPPTEANLKAIYVMYGQYTGQHRGKSPPDAEAFKKFVRSVDVNQLASLNVDDAESLFTSPRDAQPFVIHYNAEVGAPGVGGGGWLAHEETGQNGMKYVLLSTGIIEEADSARFAEIVR